MTKQCTRCGESKDLDDFKLRRGSAREKCKTEISKRMSWCRLCDRQYQREYQIRTGMDKWEKLSGNVRRDGLGPSGAMLRDQLGPPSICYLCGDPVGWEGSEIDHINPRSNGGVNEVNNLAWTHKRCNRVKHDMLLPEMTSLIAKILAHLAT